MERSPTIFISYNPNSDQEEMLAVRLQTIGAVSGFQTLLPNRYSNKRFVDEETRRSIKNADYFVIFATQDLSNIVQEEIRVAFEYFKDPSRIIIIHDTHRATNFNFRDSSATVVDFNPISDTVDIVIKKVLDQISKKEKVKVKDNDNGLLALLGIGLGLLALSAIFSESD